MFKGRAISYLVQLYWLCRNVYVLSNSPHPPIVAAGGFLTSPGRMRCVMGMSFWEFPPANLNPGDPCSHHWITAVLVWSRLQSGRRASSQAHSCGNGPWCQRAGKTRVRWGDDIIAGSTFLKAYKNAGGGNGWADFVHGANVLWDTVQR